MITAAAMNRDLAASLSQFGDKVRIVLPDGTLGDELRGFVETETVYADDTNTGTPVARQIPFFFSDTRYDVNQRISYRGQQYRVAKDEEQNDFFKHQITRV